MVPAGLLVVKLIHCAKVEESGGCAWVVSRDCLMLQRPFRVLPAIRAPSNGGDDARCRRRLWFKISAVHGADPGV